MASAEAAGGTLAVSHIAGNAWDSFWTSVKQMPLLYGSAYLGFVAVSVAMWKLDLVRPPYAAHGAHPAPLSLKYSSLEFLASVLYALVLSPVAVAVHRFILRGETTTGIISLRAAHTQMYVVWLILLALLQWAAMLPGLLPTTYSPFVAAMAFATAVALAFTCIATIRLSLVFPAVAIDAPGGGIVERAAASWNLTHGRFWKIFWIEIVTSLPLAVLVLVLYLVGLLAVALIWGDANGRPSVYFGEQSWIAISLRAIPSVAGGAVLAASVSWIYRTLTPPGQARAAPSPLSACPPPDA